MKNNLLVNLLIPLCFLSQHPANAETYICTNSGLGKKFQSLNLDGKKLTLNQGDDVLQIETDYEVIRESDRHIIGVNTEDVLGDEPLLQVMFVDKEKLTMSATLLYPFGGKRFGFAPYENTPWVGEEYAVDRVLEDCTKVD